MSKKPNVLFLLADDQRFNTIAALGNPEIHTPNLDRLAARGMAFTQAHIPGGTSGAVCMPSRAMINSGKELFHLSGAGEQIPCDHVTMGQAFRNAGYDTIGIGKWHNGTESFARSFSDGDNIFFGGMWDHWNVPVNGYHEDGRYENKINYTCDFFRANHPMQMIAERINAGKHSTELFTDCAIDFIEKEKDSDKPFFLYTALLAPHDPRTMPEKFKNMYDPEALTLPDNWAREHFYYGFDWSRTRDEDLAGHPRTEKEIRRHLADYYAMISHIDEHVGLVLDALERTGQLDNTIIVYAGDNGLAVGCHGLMGKQNVYDHSVHVPLLVSGPGIAANQRSDAYVYLMDIYPSLCQLCGIAIPDSVEGKSFVPVLQGGEGARDVMYFAMVDLIRAVQDRQFKLIKYRDCPENNQLFDIVRDPLEQHNLYQDASHREDLVRMEQLLQQLRAHWEDDPENEFTKGYWSKADA